MIGLGITIWQWIYGGGGVPVPSGNFLLLADGTSYLLLADGVSRLELAGNP